MQAQIINTGGRALDLSGTLKLSSVSGSLNAGPYPVRLGTSLAPHQSEPVTIPVTDQIADGPWHATLELRSGLLDKTFHAKITFPHGEGTASASVVDPGSSGSLALVALAGGTITLGAALLFSSLRRRRSRRNS